MLSEEQRARVTVVLVRARNPNNIGAVARAMHGFGFADLRLVNDYSVGFEKAKSAVDASAILAAAREFPTVADAVADCSLVVGTTAVGERKQEHSLYTLAQAGSLLRSTAATCARSPALWIGEDGPEQRCHEPLPLAHDHSHAPDSRSASRVDEPGTGGSRVPLRAGTARQTRPAPSETQPAAQAEDLERVTHLLAEMLTSIGYARRRPAAADPAAVRRMVRRLNLNQSDARRWIGILRQLLWKISE